MKTLRMVLAVICCALVLESCSDSSTTTPTTPPTDTTKLLPLSVGNSWIYKRQDVDSSTGALKGPVYTDSAFVKDSLLIGGRSSYRVIYVQLETDQQDTSFFSLGADGSISTYFDANAVGELQNIAPGVVIPRMWINVKPASNSTASSWTSYDTTFLNVKVKLGGQEITLPTANCKVVGTKGQTVQVPLSGGTRTATEYVVNFIVSGAGGLVTYNMPQRFWFVDKVGLYQLRTDNASVIASGSVVRSFAGTQSTLVRYTVKQ